MNAHDDCAFCAGCDRHLDATEIWPCLDCGLVLCDTCECPNLHVAEACS